MPYQLHQQEFLNYLRFEKRYSEHTIISYQTDLHQFFAYLTSQFDGPALPEVSTAIIRSWLTEQRAGGTTPISIKRKTSTLQSFFKYLMQKGVVQRSPLVGIIPPKTGKKLPQFVSEQEMQILGKIDFGDTLKGITHRLCIHIFYETGLRLSELISLKISNIDDYNSQIKVLGKGNKERIIPVSAHLIAQIKEYISRRQQEGFYPTPESLLITEKGKVLYPRYVYNAVKSYLSLVTTINKKSPHVLRHTSATHLLNKGADLNAVKELLGHSSLAATQVYTHNTIDKLKAVHQQAHPKA